MSTTPVEGYLELGSLSAFGGSLRDVRVWTSQAAHPPFDRGALFLHYPLAELDHPSQLGLRTPFATLGLYHGALAVRDHSHNARHGYVLLKGREAAGTLGSDPWAPNEQMVSGGPVPGPPPPPATSAAPAMAHLHCPVHNCVRSDAPSEYRGFGAAAAGAAPGSEGSPLNTSHAPAPAPACEPVSGRPVCGERGWSRAPGDVRMCGTSPWPETGCALNLTQAEAAAACATMNARLCTLAQLEAGAASGSGCMLDWAAVWSATACNATPETPAFWTVTWNPARQSSCVPAPSRHALRCCAEEPATGHYAFSVGAWVRYDVVPVLQSVVTLRAARHAVRVRVARQSGFELSATSPLQGRSEQVVLGAVALANVRARGRRDAEAPPVDSSTREWRGAGVS